MSRLSFRIKEASTWKGVVYSCTATSLALYPKFANEITVVAFGLSGIIGILFSDAPYDGPELETKPTP